MSNPCKLESTEVILDEKGNCKACGYASFEHFIKVMKPLQGQKTANAYGKDANSGTKMKPLDDTKRITDNDRIYQGLAHLHRQEHIGDNCFCTTEISGVYRIVLDEINNLIAAALKEKEKKL